MTRPTSGCPLCLGSGTVAGEFCNSCLARAGWIRELPTIEEHLDWLEGRRPSEATGVPDGCRIEPLSSRACELGTKSCTVRHGRTETQNQDLGGPGGDPRKPPPGLFAAPPVAGPQPALSSDPALRRNDATSVPLGPPLEFRMAPGEVREFEERCRLEAQPLPGIVREPPEGLDCSHRPADVIPYTLRRIGVLEWCDRCGAIRCLGAEWTYPTEWYRRPEAMAPVDEIAQRLSELLAAVEANVPAHAMAFEAIFDACEKARIALRPWMPEQRPGFCTCRDGQSWAGKPAPGCPVHRRAAPSLETEAAELRALLDARYNGAVAAIDELFSEYEQNAEMAASMAGPANATFDKGMVRAATEIREAVIFALRRERATATVEATHREKGKER